MKKLTFLLFICLFSCTISAQNEYDKMAIAASKAWLDIDYVGDQHMGHRLDIHLPPEGKGPFPVVVAIYGSAWFSNSSKSATFSTGLGQKLLEGGFAVVSINHRSSHDAKFPAQIQDVKAAIRFIRANAGAFDLNPNFLGITGWSSGGHLAVMAGVTNETGEIETEGIQYDLEGSLGKFTDTDSRVDAVVDWYGPTDFLIMDECGSSFSHDAADSPESSLIGGAIQENKVKSRLANPVTYVKNPMPPFLIFHGDKDPLVPLCQSEKLYERLSGLHSESELVVIPGGKHGPGVMIDPYFDRMVAFFKTQMEE